MIENKDHRQLSLLTAATCCLRIYGGRPFSTHESIRASQGRILLSGSQTKNFATKSIKSLSSQASTPSKLFEPGLLIFPLLFGRTRTIFPQKNLWLLDPRQMSESGGTPSTSMNMSICYCSFSPGKSGQPRQSSARMQPIDHISIAGEYVNPSMISGARQNLLWMQVQICSGWKHPEPKSIILMPVFPYCFNRMFSGFRSQCMISCLLRKSNPCKTCMATRLIMSMVRPLNFSSRLSSYRLICSSSKTRQACPLKKKPCLSWTILLFPFGSIIATVSRMRISTLACRLNFASFLITFKATSQRFLWSNDLKT